MKKTLKVLGGATALALVLSLVGPLSVSAAVGVAPSLGIAAPFSTWGKTGVTNFLGVSTTTHWGDVGADNIASITNLVAGQVGGTIQGPTPGVQTDIGLAYTALAAQLLPPGNAVALNLAAPPVSIAPGVYNIGATTLAGPLNLSGAGVYIFLSAGGTVAVTPGVGASVNLSNGACASDVYWGIADTMTIGSGAHIEGTIITNTAAITLGDSATLKGRALSHIAAVTMINSQISEPVCAAVSGGISIPNNARMTINKIVIGGPLGISDFPLFVNGTPFVSGDTPTFPAPTTYTLTETTQPNYTQSFTGDCNASGVITLVPGDILRTCTLTNTYNAPVVVPPVPPLIDVVKVPSPLSLPAGPGLVTYTYTTRNIGTVPMTNVTMVGDTCSPIIRISGDTNNNLILEVSETWVYTCVWNLTATHTNVVTARGWANGISATDIASATVIVGQPIVPPLIHITKVPSPLTLRVGGGLVTYTMKVTNPGTVALSNVITTDDKCSPVTYISGDTNSNSMLETTETWTYTCTATLTKTTTNTATASGVANGMTATDFAIANVIVATAVPALPNTGAATEGTPWNMIILAGVLMTVTASLALALRKRTN